MEEHLPGWYCTACMTSLAFPGFEIMWMYCIYFDGMFKV